MKRSCTIRKVLSFAAAVSLGIGFAVIPAGCSLSEKEQSKKDVSSAESSQQKKVSKEEESALKQIALYEDYLNRYEEVLKHIEEMKAECETLYDSIYFDPVSVIKDTFKKYSLNFTSFSVGEDAPYDSIKNSMGELVYSKKIKFQVNTDKKHFIEFIKDLENGQGRIESISITKSDKELLFDVSIDYYFLKQKEVSSISSDSQIEEKPSAAAADDLSYESPQASYMTLSNRMDELNGRLNDPRYMPVKQLIIDEFTWTERLEDMKRTISSLPERKTNTSEIIEQIFGQIIEKSEDFESVVYEAKDSKVKAVCYFMILSDFINLKNTVNNDKFFEVDDSISVSTENALYYDEITIISFTMTVVSEE